MDERTRIIERLRELKSEHEAALGQGPGEAPGFIQDEQSTRKSYKLVAQDAVDNGLLTIPELKAAGLPKTLEESEEFD